MMYQENYKKYRGLCKELSEAFVIENPDYEIVRGWYYEPLWSREEPHWWCKHKETGEIHDPTKLQFPSGGIMQFYREFDGILQCEQCGKEVEEKEAGFYGNYAFCSVHCIRRCLGV
jgi:hypothetical protein